MYANLYDRSLEEQRLWAQKWMAQKDIFNITWNCGVNVMFPLPPPEAIATNEKVGGEIFFWSQTRLLLVSIPRKSILIKHDYKLGTAASHQAGPWFNGTLVMTRYVNTFWRHSLLKKDASKFRTGKPFGVYKPRHYKHTKTQQETS